LGGRGAVKKEKRDQKEVNIDKQLIIII